MDQLGPVQKAGLGDIINPLLAGASTGLLYKSTGAFVLADTEVHTCGYVRSSIPGVVVVFWFCRFVLLVAWLLG